MVSGGDRPESPSSSNHLAALLSGVSGPLSVRLSRVDIQLAHVRHILRSLDKLGDFTDSDSLAYKSSALSFL